MPEKRAADGGRTGAKITIAPLTGRDYEAMVALWKAAGLTYRARGRDSLESIESQIKRPTAIYLKAVVRENGQDRIVGVVLGSHDGRRGWINRLAVMPGFQKRGVGGMLVEELERRLAKLGLLLVAVQVDRGNIRSLRFFKGLGYRLHDDIHYLSKRKGDWA